MRAQACKSWHSTVSNARDDVWQHSSSLVKDGVVVKMGVAAEEAVGVALGLGLAVCVPDADGVAAGVTLHTR